MNIKLTLCAFILLCIFLTSCNFDSSRSNIPKEASLKIRVQTLYQAESSHEWKTFYQIIAPQVRKETSYKQFIEERNMWPIYKKIEWSINKVDSIIVPDAKENPGARVLMDATYILNDGRREYSKDQTDYWIYIDGEWYWFHRGYPAD